MLGPGTKKCVFVKISEANFDAKFHILLLLGKGVSTKLAFLDFAENSIADERMQVAHE